MNLTDTLYVHRFFQSTFESSIDKIWRYIKSWREKAPATAQHRNGAKSLFFVIQIHLQCGSTKY